MSWTKGRRRLLDDPPRLNRNFCTIDLPLDLPDSVIIGPHEAFEVAKSQLDENGWSNETMVHPVSRHRALLLLSLVREEILELALGPALPDLAQKARYICHEKMQSRRRAHADNP